MILKNKSNVPSRGSCRLLCACDLSDLKKPLFLSKSRARMPALTPLPSSGAIIRSQSKEIVFVLLLLSRYSMFN